MAIVYVDSNAAGTAAGTSWTDAYLTLQAALTAYAAGDEIWVAHNHAETSASTVVWTSAAANTSKQKIPVYRVNSGTDVYSPTTSSDTIQMDITGVGADLQIDASISFYGLSIKVKDNLQINLTGSSVVFTDCYLEFPSDANKLLTDNDVSIDFIRTTLNFKLGILEFRGGVGKFDGCTFTGTMGTAALIQHFNGRNSDVKFISCDFSAMDAGTMAYFAGGANNATRYQFINCDIPSGMTWTDGGFGIDSQWIEVFNTDSGGNLYVSRKENLRGTITEDTGVYVSGGYQDADGTISLSMKMATRAATTEPHSPLESMPILARIETTGSKTFTVECVENFTTALTKREAWIDVYYLGSATETLWNIADDRELVATSYTNLAAGTGLGNWTGEPAGSRSVKLTASATVNQAGLYQVKVFLGEYESGKVLHYDPLVTVA